MPRIDRHGYFRSQSSFEFSPQPPFAGSRLPGGAMRWPHLRALLLNEVPEIIGVHPKYARSVFNSPLANEVEDWKKKPVRIYSWADCAEQARLTLGSDHPSMAWFATGFPRPTLDPDPAIRAAHYDWSLGRESTQRIIHRIPDIQPIGTGRWGDDGSAFSKRFQANVQAGLVSQIAIPLPEPPPEDPQSLTFVPTNPGSAFQELIGSALAGVCDIYAMPDAACLERAQARKKRVSFDTYEPMVFDLANMTAEEIFRWYGLNSQQHFGYFKAAPEVSHVVRTAVGRNSRWGFDTGDGIPTKATFMGHRMAAIGSRAILNMLNIRNYHPLVRFRTPVVEVGNGYFNPSLQSLIESRQIDTIAMAMPMAYTGQRNSRDRWNDRRFEESQYWLPDLFRLCYENAVDLMLLHPAMYPFTYAREIPASEWEALRDVPEDWSPDDE